MSGSISRQLIISFLSILLFSTITSGIAIKLLNDSRNSAFEVMKNATNLKYKSTKLKFNVMQMSNSLRGMLLNPDNKTEYNNKFSADENFSKLIEELKAETDEKSILTPILLLEEMDKTKLNFMENKLVNMLKTDEVKAENIYWTEYLPILQEETNLVDKIAETSTISMDNNLKIIDIEYNKMVFIVLILLGFSLILGLIAALYISRLIAKPLAEMAKIAKAISKGDIRQNINITGTNEIGILAESFRDTITYINDIAYVAQRISNGNIDISIKKISENDILNESFSNTVSYINEIASVSEKISLNDLSVNIVPRTNEDVLNYSLNRMLSNLKDIVKNLKESSNLISITGEKLFNDSEQIFHGANTQVELSSGTLATAEEFNILISHVQNNIQTLLANINESSAAIEEITNSIQHVANNTIELNKSLENTSLIVSETSASVEEVSANARIVMIESQNAVKEAQQGKDAVENTIKSMESISVTMVEMEQSIQKLSSDSMQIDGIVEIIKDLASQTNLLALNAAIESARAGEHGRGFAVVADEVRKLAERSNSYAKEISKLIVQIQDNTNNTNEITKNVSEKVKEGLTLANRSGEVLYKNVETIEKTSLMMDEISKATEEQINAWHNVVETVENAFLIAEQVSITTTQQATSSEQILRSVEYMKVLGEQVNTAISEQKIGSDHIVKSVSEITDISKHNLEIVDTIAEYVSSLSQQSEQLKGVVDLFKMPDNNENKALINTFN